MEWNQLGAHERLVQDYFCEPPLYDDVQFKHRFRMSRRLFVKSSNNLTGEPLFSRKGYVQVAKLVSLDYKSVQQQSGN
ncbi:hypothetical protein Hanom_Chr09g00842651 [Helianthus anomalus]